MPLKFASASVLRRRVIAVLVSAAVAFAIIFSIYKLLVLSAGLVIVIIVIATVLVCTLAYSLKEASARLTLTSKQELAKLAPAGVRSWAIRQFRLMRLFLFFGLCAALGLLALGLIPAWSFVIARHRDFIDYFLLGFGITITCVGIYFTAVVFKEFKFTYSHKDMFIEKLMNLKKDAG